MRILPFLLIAIFLLSTSTSVLAQDTSNTPALDTAREKTQEKREAVKERVIEKKEAVREKVTERKDAAQEKS